MIRDVLKALNHEVWLVTTQAGSERAGLTATCVSTVSIVAEMPRVLVGLAKQHRTSDLIEVSRSFTLHLLAEDQTDLAFHFGLTSSRDGDKFVQLACTPSPLGNPRLTAAPAWLDCRVETAFDIGDRVLYLAEVVDGDRADQRPLLTMQRLLVSATPEQKRQLAESITHGAAIDAPRIVAWRLSVS